MDDSLPPSHRLRTVRPRLAAGARAVGGFAILLAGVTAVGGPMKGPTTTLVTGNAAGTSSADSSTYNGNFSANSRFVGFASEATNLVLGDLNGQQDVFLRDLKKRTTSLVTVDMNGNGPGNGLSFISGMSANGRYVLFSSYGSDLVPGDLNGKCDAFVRDMKTGTTILVSGNAQGTGPANGKSFAQGISADGRYAAFVSDAPDLLPPGDGIADENGATDVFVRDLRTGTTTLVSINAAGTAAGSGEADDSWISPNGRFVLFTDDSGDLVGSGANGFYNTFLRDLRTGTTTLVSVNAAGTGGGAGDSSPSDGCLSADGRWIAFSSDAEDLVAGDSNGKRDVFLRDRKTGTTTLVTVAASGTAAGAGDSYLGRLTPNGRFVVFVSAAEDLVANDGNGSSDAFVRDLKKGTTTLVSVNAAGTGGGTGGAFDACLSADGRLVAFDSMAEDLVDGDSNGVRDVFVRDMVKGTTTLVSIRADGMNGGELQSDSPVISPNGRLVLFTSAADDLVIVQDDGDAGNDLFLRPIR